MFFLIVAESHIISQQLPYTKKYADTRVLDHASFLTDAPCHETCYVWAPLIAKKRLSIGSLAYIVVRPDSMCLFGGVVTTNTDSLHGADVYYVRLFHNLD